jgi:hypothetical protein
VAACAICTPDLESIMTNESTRGTGSKQPPKQSEGAAETKRLDPAVKGTQTLYRDRPTDDGKQGDGAQEPNEGFPHA